MEQYKLTEFLESEGSDSMATRYESFFGYSSDDNTFDEMLTNDVFANVAFKHKYAKELFNKVLTRKKVVLTQYLTDSRLYSLLLYRLYVYILNSSIEPNKEDDIRKIISIIGLNNGYHLELGSYLKGYCLYSDDLFAPVRMTSGDELLHPGHRLFTINLLCFREREVLLGIRGDGFIPRCTRYHKGCKPIGIKEDARGRKWLLMRACMTWSDDHTAIFSNETDGDATLEICDWVNENDVRVIFRADI